VTRQPHAVASTTLRPSNSLLKQLAAFAVLLGAWLLLLGDVVFDRRSLFPLPSDHMLGIEFADGTGVAGKPWAVEPVAAVLDFPTLVLASRALAQGGLLQINPYMGTGHPLLADLYSRPFSPCTLPMLFSPTLQTFSLCLALPLLIALCGGYLFFRELGASRPLAVAAALCWGVGCYSTRYLNFSEVSAGAFLPWILLGAIRRLRQSDKVFPGDLVGLILCGWAGHPAVLLFAVALWVAIVAAAPGALGRLARWRIIAQGLFVLFLATCPLTWPLLSNRSSMISYKEFVDFRPELELGHLLSRNGSLFIAPALLLLGAVRSGPLAGPHRFWTSLCVVAWIAIAVLTRLPTFFLNRFFNPSYSTIHLLLLVATAVVVSAAGPPGERRGLPVGAIAAGGLLVLQAVAHASGFVGGVLLDWQYFAALALALVSLLAHSWALIRARVAAAPVELPAALARSLQWITVVFIVATSLLNGWFHLIKLPPARLATTHPFEAAGVQRGLAGRLLVIGAQVWEHPLPPNLAGYWEIGDFAQVHAVLTQGYLEQYLEAFGLPYYATMFMPTRSPLQDPARLGVAEVVWYDPARRSYQVRPLGGYVAGWRARDRAEWTPLAAPTIGYQRSWQTFTWALPEEAARAAGLVQVKLTPLNGYRWRDGRGEIVRVDDAAAGRWLEFVTEPGQRSVELLYREDAFWLGSLAALLGVGLLVRDWRRGVRRG